MRNFKRKLAALLTAVLLISMLPVSALAAAAEDASVDSAAGQQASAEQQALAGQQTPMEQQASVGQQTPMEQQASAGQQTPIEQQTSAEQQSSTGQQAPTEQQILSGQQPADEVTYNTGCLRITVTADEDNLYSEDEEGNPLPYVLFEEDGNFAIPVEPNAFFPYEVQFTYQGRTWEEWFMTPDDTVDVGGHTFSVLYEGDTDTLSQIGVWIGDTYVPAYPEKKTFTDDGGTVLFSMGPLATGAVYTTLDLSAYARSQLTNVQVSTVLGGLKDENTNNPLNPTPVGTKVAWAKGWGNDGFKIIDGTSGVLDLSPPYYSQDDLRLELIVGTAAQLDLDNNTLYTVDVTLAPYEMFKWALKDSGKQDILLSSDCYLIKVSGMDAKAVTLWAKPSFDSSKGVLLTMDFVPEVIGKTAKVYEGFYESIEALHAAASPVELTSAIWGSGAEGTLVMASFYEAGYGPGNDYVEYMPITVLLCDSSGTELAVERVQIRFEKSTVFVYPDHVGGFDSSGNYISNILDNDKPSYYENDVEVFELPIKSNLTVTSCAVPFSYQFGGQTYQNDPGQIEKSVAGLYNSLADAAGAADITSDLFYSGAMIQDLSKDTDFTVFDKYGGVHKIRIRFKKADPKPAVVSKELSPLRMDTYFRANGINGISSGDCYVMPYEHDSYYSNGYQTILTTDSMLDLSQLKLNFYKNADKIVVKNADGSGTTEQISGQSVNDFSGGNPVQYAVAAENGTDLKNYFVTVVQKETTGPGKLFVNGINGSHGAARTIFLTEAYENRHDIFIANVGAAGLTGLKVTLTDAENVKLDDYWTVGGNGNNTLAPLEISGGQADKGVAKIRLLSTGTYGEVKGTLTISADGQPDVVITLTGIAFAPEVVTGPLPNGVKYVPYGQFILTNNEYDWLKVSFNKVSGEFPQGVSLKPNGELYGTPQAAGNYSFALELNYSVDSAFAEDYNYTGDLIGGDSGSRDWFYLDILDNTSIAVETVTEMNNGAGYALIDRVPDNDGNAQQLFRSEGIYANYVDFWLDGRKLTEGTDYVSEDGSTKITVQGQTFGSLSAGEHTISAEFRTGGRDNLDSPLKTTSQNFTITRTSSSGNSGSSGSRPPRREVPASTPEPEKPKTAAEVFDDIHTNQWFYYDVDWAYQNELMTGVSDRFYQPDSPISYAMVLVTLARMGKVDLSNQQTTEGIPTGRWYTAAASWAKEIGILPEGPFDADVSASRGAMAEMLLKYLHYIGVDCTLPADPIPFTDAAQMTQMENDAFQVLYQHGIFKGIGNYTMDGSGITTRAQFAVLLHRLSVFMTAQR